MTTKNRLTSRQMKGFPNIGRERIYMGKGHNRFKGFTPDFFNLEGQILTDWTECKSALSTQTLWAEYDTALASYNQQYSTSGCGSLVKPTAPKYQVLIANPVDKCDTEANKRATDYNALLKNKYDNDMSVYNGKVSQCSSLVAPTAPSATRTTTDALTAFGFSGATGGRPRPMINSFLYANGKKPMINGFSYADGTEEDQTETPPEEIPPVKPDLSGLLPILVIAGVIYLALKSGKKK
uniref:Uncharacterized protein n=1 Tax=viral metagenome TaxID=1070528 RepID=A0A6M3J6M7_9ZZZZ